MRYDADILTTPETRLFDADWLRANGYLKGSAPGRNQAHFLNYADCDMVLRHFHRGGLMGRINGDLYLRTGADKSRALREFDLLDMMRAKGLAVPRPVAAHYAPVGPFYRADLITLRIANARTVAEMVQDDTLPAHLWTAIGAAIAKLHDARIFHSDLNCRNIMIDADGVVWLIDFDKCYQREPGTWMQENLDRLHRSLVKLTSEDPAPNWQGEDWELLLSGYAKKITEP